MPKDKISDYSATANSNTDIGGINIDEGCAPSGINDAIRTLMKQLKDFQQGTNSDSFNGPVGSTTASTGAFTTLTTTSTINGLTVGKGAGAVSTNTAVGASALAANTTGSSNTAIGSSAGYSNQDGTSLTAVGLEAGYSNTSGSNNVFMGRQAGKYTTTASDNTGIGTAALTANTTGASNTAVGRQALAANTTASNNTAVGYQALYSVSTNGTNTAIGNQAGYSTTGGFNTFIGNGAGYDVSSGTKNTILGRYSGNSGGLDIRTASNYIVLSDGDGVPAAVRGALPNAAGSYAAYANAWTFGNGGTAATNDGVIFLNGTSYGAGYGPAMQGRLNGTAGWSCGSYSWVIGGSSSSFFACQNSTGGVYLNGSSATSWTAVSDETRKVIIEPITDAANKVATLRTVIGRLKSDDETVRRPYLIAQDVQAVLPEAVSEAEDKDGPVLGLSYTEVIPLLVAAIKELKAEIDTLKGQA